MEITNPKRSTITETFEGIEIIVPAKKYWFVIVFLGLWLCFWSVGEFFALKTIFTGKIGIATGVYLFVWLSGWTYGGFFAFKSLWWIIAGKEVISFTKNNFTINKNGSFFYQAKTYNTSDAKNFRILEDNIPVKNFGTKKIPKSSSKKNNGVIGFDYGSDTFSFAENIDRAEANSILQDLQVKKYIN